MNFASNLSPAVVSFSIYEKEVGGKQASNNNNSQTKQKQQNTVVAMTVTALEDYFLHLRDSLPHKGGGGGAAGAAGAASNEQDHPTSGCSSSRGEHHDSDRHHEEEGDSSSSSNDEQHGANASSSSNSSSLSHAVTIVMDNARLPAHCFAFFGNDEYSDRLLDNPMEALSQSLSAINTVPFPPPFLKNTTSSRRWNFDESNSSGKGLDVSLNVPCRSRDVDSDDDDSNDNDDDDSITLIHPPGHSSSLDSTTKWLRELPFEHSPGSVTRSPVCASNSSSSLRGGSTARRYASRDVALKCPPSPALCVDDDDDDDDELPSLRECPYDEEVEVHPRRSSLSGMIDVSAISAALELLDYDENEDEYNKDAEKDDSSSDDDDSIIHISDDEEEDDGEEEEEQPEDDEEDDERNLNDSSFLSVGQTSVDDPTCDIMSPSCKLGGGFLDRRSRLLSHISPTVISDFPYSSPIIVRKKEDRGSPSNSHHKGTNTIKSPSSSSSSNSSRHHQLVKKLSVVFEKDEIDLLVVDGLST